MNTMQRRTHTLHTPVTTGYTQTTLRETSHVVSQVSFSECIRAVPTTSELTKYLLIDTHDFPKYNIPCVRNSSYTTITQYFLRKSLQYTLELPYPSKAKVFVIEKDTVFQRIVQTITQSPSLQSEFRHCIFLTSRGYPTIEVRAMLHKLHLQGVPIFTLVDADPYGLEIFITYVYGAPGQTLDCPYHIPMKLLGLCLQDMLFQLYTAAVKEAS